MGEEFKFGEYLKLARTDPEFRARLRAEPAAALAERGVSLAPGVALRLAEDTSEVRHFVLPPDPNVQLADSGLDAVSGGSTVTWSSSGSYGFI